ncbi:sugar-binding transcriptional regulator [Kitasatospora sp. NPDC088548]|uniref:sugar-binding transcriptional regulator n=1 Tax=Kitasatospora sp. NPDC088548 TaxID=3364075 RepID=UPI00381ACC78
MERTNDHRQPPLGKIARLYYEHGLTHQEIADLCGLSRIKVTRLLAEARRVGIVEITVHSDDHLFVGLESALGRAYPLRQAWVGPTFEDEARAAHSLGAVAAECVSALLEDRATVAVGLSASVATIPRHLRPGAARDVNFVPLTGSGGGISRAASSHELALAFAAGAGGHAYHLPAPLLARTPQAAQVWREDPAVQETLERAVSADVLVAGIGGRTGLLVENLSASDLAATRGRGAVGDISGRFFDANGAAVPCEVDDRLIGLSLAQLRAVPVRIGVARGAAKLQALRVALSQGLINVLVTDSSTAEGLLAAAGADAPAGAPASAGASS